MKTHSLESKEFLLTHQLNDYFSSLSTYSSTKKIQKSILYQGLKEDIHHVAYGVEYGFYAPTLPFQKKTFYRVVAWNLERGIQFDGILKALKNHPEISKADLLLLTETDSGMARSQNRNVARELALELGMNYFFSPSYLNLCMGNSVESHFTGVNELGLHGNAILSRYPLDNLRAIPLKNCKDKMKGSEKRLGCQKALVAEVSFPYQKVTAICAHLDAHSSQRQRAGQMETIFSSLDLETYPVLLGGDLNTSSYNARHAFFAFCGFWNKVFRGVDDVIDNHYPYPDRYYDKRLFDVLRRFGFDYETFNEIGTGTLHYHVDDLKGNYLVKEVVPEWCRKIMETTLRRHGGKVSIKMDWFAGKGIKLASPETGALLPKVIGQLKEGDKPLSDHDAILVDIVV